MEKFEENHFTTTNPLETTSDTSSSMSEPMSSVQSPSSSDHSPVFSENGKSSNVKNQKRIERKSTSFAYRVREHVMMGPNLTETVIGKLSVGAKIIKKGGRENIFRDIFGIIDGEKLLKSSQCYLSTTTGPIAGILFISTEKIAFCSERSITVNSSSEGTIRIPYKICIPVKKIKEVNESENVKNSAQKYIQIVTRDDFEFWFMGFLRYEKAFINLQKVISLCS